MSEAPADAAAAASEFRAYARTHGLTYFENWGVPEATQLLRRGFAQEVRNLGIGNLPGGIANAWLAHVSFATTGGGGLEQHPFTVVICRVPKSIAFAVRVLCHDRGLADELRSNPEADTEIVELDDRGVELESELFLARYAVSTDHDQDRVRVWQLFSPAVIHWLTADAPRRFSFELQDGALCCFVPGVLGTADELDALCAAAGRVHARVLELAATSTVSAEPDSRQGIIERALAEHPFADPPPSVWAAARAFGWWGLITGRSWRLGAEAFFRAYARGIGFERIDDAEFRASHIATPFPGEITQIAEGRLAPVERPAWLILTKDPVGQTSGWKVFIVDPKHRDRMYAFVNVPERVAAEKEGIEIVADDRSFIVFAPDGGPRRRTKANIDEFLATARKLVLASIEAGTPKR